MSDFTSNHQNDTAVPSIEKSAGNGTNGLQNAKDAVVNNAYSAGNAIANHPVTQSAINGPVAANVKDQHAKTQAEFSNLAASRTTPATPAATGQQLTHYHSFFSSLLSWNNPRASAIAFASIVTFIFAARYLDILRYTFKFTWMTLGITVFAEVLGKATLGHGLTSQFRPKKYFTVSKSTLDSLTGDVNELINFFVIESQRIVFAENLFASATAFLGAFISYYLIKFVPFWGLSLIGTTVLFIAPLTYKTNKELIDHYIAQAASIVNQQSQQVRQLASEQAARATSTTKQYVGDYSSKAQELIGSARGRSASPNESAKPVKTEPTFQKENVPAYKQDDFPIAPKKDFSAAPQHDFPVAPKDDFKAPPSVEDTIAGLKAEDSLI